MAGVPKLGYMYPKWYICLSQGVHLGLATEGKNILCIIQFKYFIQMNLSEPFRGVLNPYLFSVYLDDLFLELNSVKAGCYIGEVLLNHLRFAECFVQVYLGCKNILDVFQAYTKPHGIIFSCSNTVCMTFKAKTVKSTVIPLLTLVCKE